MITRLRSTDHPLFRWCPVGLTSVLDEYDALTADTERERRAIESAFEIGMSTEKEKFKAKVCRVVHPDSREGTKITSAMTRSQ